MEKLTRPDLYSLEIYHDKRPELRRQVLAHKAARKVLFGAHAALYFEDRLTVQYQIQEMLRVERIFVGAAIQDELDAYNPLIPDGRNFKATMLIEYEDEKARRSALAKLKGIENKTWVQVEGSPKVYEIGRASCRERV